MMVKTMAKQTAQRRMPRRGDRRIRWKTLAPYDLRITCRRTMFVLIHQRVSHEGLVGADAAVEVVDVVEEAEVVEDLEYERRDGQKKGSQVDDLNYFTGPRLKEGPASDEEGPNLYPGYNIVEEVRAVEEGGRGREIPPVTVEGHEAEGALTHGEALLAGRLVLRLEGGRTET